MTISEPLQRPAFQVRPEGADRDAGTASGSRRLAGRRKARSIAAPLAETDRSRGFDVPPGQDHRLRKQGPCL